MTAAAPAATLFPEPSAIPEAHRLPGRLDQQEYLIDGELLIWQGARKEVVSPICVVGPEGPRQVVLGSHPLLSAEESEKALHAALRAYDNGRGAWPSMTVNERLNHMEAFVKAMREKRTEVVRWLMWEIGKTLKDSEKEFDRTVDYIVATLAQLKQLHRDTSKFLHEEGIVAQVRRSPFGVALCMGPYNYPLNETFATLIPALVMGNTVVFKPARHGVLLNRPLLEPLRDCFPRGVINVIYGDGRSTAGAVMATGKVDLFAFIGTHKGANDIKRLHPKPNRLRSVLGLDAKNPAIVLADADLDLAVQECVLGSLSFNGQRCTAIKIIHVQRAVADAFVAKFCEAVAKLKAGMPWEAGVSLTPLPEPGKTQFLKDLMDDAISKGARVMNPGGGAHEHTYFHPAVLYPVLPDMQLWEVEQFGPLVPIAVFDDIEEPINYCVESNYGQQVSLFSQDPAQIAYLIDPLTNQVGRVNINSQCQRGPDSFPFNGRKDSAEGTLSVYDALRVFSIRTVVAAKETPNNTGLLQQIVTQRHSSYLNTDYLF